MDPTMLRIAFDTFVSRVNAQRREIDQYCKSKMAYKVLYLLKKHRRESVRKKIYKKVAGKFLAF